MTERERNRDRMTARGKRTAVAWLMTAIVAAVAGCGDDSGLPLAPVYGKVTYNGEPLSHGQVVFVPGPGVAGPSAVGEIASNGTFRMTTANHDGAVIGTHKVTVHCRRPLTPEEEKSLKITELLIPAKYANEEETPLTVDVVNGNNEFNLELID